MKLQEILKARGITDEQLKEVQEQDIPAALRASSVSWTSIIC